MPQQDSDLWFFPRGWGYRREAVDQYRQYASGRIRELEGQVQALQQQVAELRTAARGREQIADAVLLLAETRARANQEAASILEAARREARAIREAAQAEADAVRHEIAAAVAKDTARLQAFRQAVQETLARARGAFEAGLALVERAGGLAVEPPVEAGKPGEGPGAGGEGAWGSPHSPEDMWDSRGFPGGWPAVASASDAPAAQSTPGDGQGWYSEAQAGESGAGPAWWPSAHPPSHGMGDFQSVGDGTASQAGGTGLATEDPAVAGAGPWPDSGSAENFRQTAVPLDSEGTGAALSHGGAECGSDEPPPAGAEVGAVPPVPSPVPHGTPPPDQLELDAPLDGPPLPDDAPRVGGPGLRRRP